MKYSEMKKKYGEGGIDEETMNYVKIAVRMRRRRTVIIICVLAVFAWCVMFTVDYFRAECNQIPVFAIPLGEMVFDGDDLSVSSVKVYTGAGYKVMQYIGGYSRSDCHIGTWFMKPDDVNSILQSEITAIEKYAENEQKVTYHDERYFANVKIFDCTANEDGTKTVYLWLLVESHCASDVASGHFEDGWSSGASVPAVFTIKTENGKTDILDTRYPGDGNEYAADIKEMFGKSARYVIRYFGTDEYRDLRLANEYKALGYYAEYLNIDLTVENEQSSAYVISVPETETYTEPQVFTTKAFPG